MKDITILIVLTFLIGSNCQSGIARCTYHSYQASTPLTNVACSDGQNGIINWGYKDLSPMFPYVTAWQEAGWNSPKCGLCMNITSKTATVFVTIVDQCGKSDRAGTSHFDISKEAFVALFGQEGLNKGTMEGNYALAHPKQCKGNRHSLIN